MKQIITLFTMFSFIIYIGGCTKSVKHSIADLENQQQAEHLAKYKVTQIATKNDKIIKIKKNGRLNIDSNTITGISISKDTINVKFDDVKYFSIKIGDPKKNFILLGAIGLIGVTVGLALSDITEQ